MTSEEWKIKQQQIAAQHAARQSEFQEQQPEFPLSFDAINSFYSSGDITLEQRNQMMRENNFTGVQSRGINLGPTSQEIQARIDQASSQMNDPQPIEGRFATAGRGLLKGFSDIGAGMMQVGIGAADYAGLLPETGADGQPQEPGAIQERMRQELLRRDKEFEIQSSLNPKSGFLGEVGGMAIPAIPAGIIAAPTVAMGAILGAGTSFFMPTKSESPSIERLANSAFGAFFGATLAKVLPAVGGYIASGYNKLTATAKVAYEKVTGQTFNKNFIKPDGSLTEEGIEELTRVGLNKSDLDNLADNIDLKTANDLKNAFINGLKNKTPSQIDDPAATAAAARGTEFDVPLTSARINQDFSEQTAENMARNIVDDPIGDEARLAAKNTTDALVTAGERFINRLGGNTEAVGPEIGAIIKKGMADINVFSAQEVRQLYKTAGEIVGNNTKINKQPLLEAFDDIFDITALDQATKDSLEALFAQYGLLGKVNPSDKFSAIVNGRTVRLPGGSKDFNLQNAEIFRQRLNQLFKQDKTGGVASIIRTLDDNIDDAIETAIKGKQTGSTTSQARQDAFIDARGSRVTRAQEFEAKDIIQDLISVKNGTTTPTKSAEQYADAIFAKGKGFSNIERLEQVLLKGTGSKTIGKTVWQDVGKLAIDRLLKDSIDPTSGVFSGARLNTAYKSIGGGDTRVADKMIKKLLGETQFNTFKRFQKLAGDATIDLKGTTNPSGSATTIINALLTMMQGVPGLSTVSRLGGTILRSNVNNMERDATKKIAQNSIRSRTVKKLTPQQAKHEELLAKLLGQYTTLSISSIPSEEFIQQ
jgi:hypothetical protein